MKIKSLWLKSVVNGLGTVDAQDKLYLHILKNGQINPIRVVELVDGCFWCVDGLQRLRCLRKRGGVRVRAHVVGIATCIDSDRYMIEEENKRRVPKYKAVKKKLIRLSVTIEDRDKLQQLASLNDESITEFLHRLLMTL